MQATLLSSAIAAFAFAAMGADSPTTAWRRPMEAVMQSVSIPIPPSVKAEHREIQLALEQATRAPGRVGTAARALADVLHPHFVREEQVALPPLGLLAPLAAGERPPEMATALAMADSLRRELPRMLEEHTRIRAAVQALRTAAQAERSTAAERLAEQLALHAQTEEEVLYPAAILVGDVIRARQGHE